jgi:hypothetical protein
MFLALLVGAWVWTGTASADDAPPTQEELAATAAAKKKEMRDKQLTGLAVCVIAAFTVAGVTWVLSAHNRARKREAIQKHQQAVQEAGLRQQMMEEHKLPTRPVSSEPPASDW